MKSFDLNQTSLVLRLKITHPKNARFEHKYLKKYVNYKKTLHIGSFNKLVLITLQGNSLLYILSFILFGLFWPIIWQYTLTIRKL